MASASSSSMWPRSRRISAPDWPADVLHDDVVAAAGLVEAEVEDLDDVGVHEPCGGERLALEPRDERGVLGQVLGQQLDRHLALQPAVEGQMDGRHAAQPQAVAELVAAGDLLARSRAVRRSAVSLGVGRSWSAVVVAGWRGRRRRGGVVGVVGDGRRGRRGRRDRRDRGHRVGCRRGRGRRSARLALLGGLRPQPVDARPAGGAAGAGWCSPAASRGRAGPGQRRRAALPQSWLSTAAATASRSDFSWSASAAGISALLVVAPQAVSPARSEAEREGEHRTSGRRARSLTVLQAVGERVGQPRVADRRRRARDVVVHPVPGARCRRRCRAAARPPAGRRRAAARRCRG